MPNETSAERRWFVSPYGRRAGDDAPRRITLHDCTIREGEQQPGNSLDAERRLRLAHALDDLGVPQLEVGIPARGPEHVRLTTEIARAGLRAKVTAVCRAEMAQVKPTVECGVWGVLCSVPADPLQLAHKTKIDEGVTIERAIEATRYVHDAGMYVILSAAYATRADLAFLARLLREVTAHGWADRVRVVDSAGCAGPEAIAFLVETFRRVADRPVEVHCHDDFGLGTANALAAVQAGADVVSCSVSGIGPRAGNAALEEVALALALLYGHTTDVDLAKLVPTVRAVEDAFGVRQTPYKAVSGANLLVPSEIASVGMDADPLVSQAFLPSVVGHPEPPA